MVSAPRGGFFQVNPPVADLLLDEVSAAIRAVQPGFVIDLYCGVGVFSLAAAASGVAAGLGIDNDPAAIAAAGFNARQRGLSGFRFQAAAAEAAIRDALRAAPASRSLLIVDPPRAGLGKAVRVAIVAGRPAHVVYVSCAPDTLARDLAEFRAAGYAVRSARLVDMFPRTAYFESVCVLEACGG